MMHRPTGIDGVVVVESLVHADERGSFARLHCPQDFAEAGVPFTPVQTSLSHNRLAGTLRGLHWQDPPHAETKLIRVVRGRAFDVCVDVRPHSPTFRAWFGIELEAGAPVGVLAGHGIAHGFLTLDDETDILYQIAPAHAPGQGRGARWDDRAFEIAWPRQPVVVSRQDASFAAFVVGADPQHRG